MRSIRTTANFVAWLAGLRDPLARVRIHYGPGYRVYFVERGQTVTILLAGGTKKSQSRDIKQARLLAGKV
jgi:putative addiction module killer protein